MAWRSSERTSRHRHASSRRHRADASMARRRHKKDAAYELLPRVPEDVHLRPAVGFRPARERAKPFHPDDARRREHRDAAVLELRFSEPVQINTEVVDLGQAERVEAHVAGHGPVQVLRLLEERHGQAVRVGRDGLCEYRERVCRCSLVCVCGRACVPAVAAAARSPSERPVPTSGEQLSPQRGCEPRSAPAEALRTDGWHAYDGRSASCPSNRSARPPAGQDQGRSGVTQRLRPQFRHSLQYRPLGGDRGHVGPDHRQQGQSSPHFSSKSCKLNGII